MDIFEKTNFLNNDSLLKESKALTLLEKTLKDTNNNYIKIPQIISVDKKKLVLEKISLQRPTSSQIQSLAKGLAKLHQIEFDHYGFIEDNFIGLNPQKNIISENWGEFFFEYRLLYQVNMIKNSEIKNKLLICLNSKKDTLINFLNENTSFASIVHGDLWSGNIIFDKKNVYLIDPAIYYADREVDIAMSELFGGLTKDFYLKYNEKFKLSKNYKTKKIIYNLYHYLNHYNLFGNSYLEDVSSSIECVVKL